MADLRAALWPVFERHVFGVPSTATLFNPYRDAVDGLDAPGAADLRRTNLAAYLDGFAAWPDVLLLAEAPGPHGARFSGVPLVSEAMLVDPAFPLGGVPTNAFGPPLREYSAGIVQRVIAPWRTRVLVWNTVPFHPHPAGNPRGIRPPTRAEVLACAPLLRDVLGVLRPARCLAVGRVAERALGAAGVAAEYLRHPSQGGACLFEGGLLEAMRPA